MSSALENSPYICSDVWRTTADASTGAAVTSTKADSDAAGKACSREDLLLLLLKPGKPTGLLE